MVKERIKLFDLKVYEMIHIIHVQFGSIHFQVSPLRIDRVPENGGVGALLKCILTQD